MLRSLLVGLALIATSLCNLCVAVEPESPASKSPAANVVSGIEKQWFADSVDPGDNFYLYANQKWLQQTEIPADKSDYGIFTVLDDQTRSQVRTLIEQAAGDDGAADGSAAQKVGDLYRSVLNTERRNQSGIQPVQPMLDLISGATDGSRMLEVAGTLSRSGVNGPVAAYVNNDAKSSDQYAVYLTQSGLTMPDRDYYLVDQPRYVEARAAAKAYFADLLRVMNVPTDDADQIAEVILTIETELARSQWTQTENRDPNKTYHKVTTDQLDELVGGIGVERYLIACGLNRTDQFIVRQKSYFESLAAIFDRFNPDDWRHYFYVRVLDAYAPSLDESLEQRHFEFHSKTISGIAQQEPLWKRGVSTTGSVLGELVGQLYVERHFQSDAKQAMNDLVGNLKRAFADRIRTRDWMNDGTKRQALDKLELFTTKIGYPDQWKDYSDLQIASDVLAENLIAAARFEHDRALAKLGGPIDRGEWHMTPQTINAYYNPLLNEIVFPAAILQPPFFNLRADDAVNYGAIGAVIGHEISHGFDDKGSQYDGHGNLRMWWTPADREEFERRASGLVQQYSRYEPVDGNFVNGELTLGENIGDLGGLSVAYQAYRLSLGEQPAPVIDGLTGDQRFFLGWSQIWRRLYRGPELLKRLVTDPHSPSEYRVNGIVRNMDAWYRAFDINQDDALYLNPDDRVRIW